MRSHADLNFFASLNIDKAVTLLRRMIAQWNVFEKHCLTIEAIIATIPPITNAVASEQLGCDLHGIFDCGR
jgi:hypothetical protein